MKPNLFPLIFFLSVAWLASACNQSESQSLPEQESFSGEIQGASKTGSEKPAHQFDQAMKIRKTLSWPQTFHSDSELKWYDSLMVYYLNNSENPLIESALKSGAKEDWILDNTYDHDTATYMIFHIGHDVTEADGSNPRFVTDAWIHINQKTRVLYEYDIASQTLAEWLK